MSILLFVAGTVFGLLAAWLLLRGRVAMVREALEKAHAAADSNSRRVAELEPELARMSTRLEVEQRAIEEKTRLLAEAQGQFEQAFKALSADALQRNNASFLELARTQLEQFQTRARDELAQRQQAVEHLVRPLRESMEKVGGEVRNAERARSEAYGALMEQVTALSDKTGGLATALRAPHVRGRWGEMQLRRAVEVAGMIPYCDFDEQVSATTDDGRLRPDLVVRMPGGKQVVVDAKVPLAAYLEACEARDDDVRARHLAAHARQMRDHIAKLSAKSYWQQFGATPDFVVMFVPDEGCFRAAWDQDPALVEIGVRARVHLASPTTLIALLQAIAHGWRQERATEDARRIHELGRELYDRLATLARHFAKVGRSLDGAVGAYNEAVGSLESRVLVTGRKLEAHGMPSAELPQLAPLDRKARPLQAVELTESARELGAGDANAA